MSFKLVDLERASHGLKTALACLVGFVITKVFYFEIDQWLIISIIVVMCAQLSVGSMIQKSYMRFLGTFLGSVIAALTLYFAHDNEVIYAVVIALTAMIFSYIATADKGFNEAGTLGAVTVVIILIGQNPTLMSALERFFEISLGIVIAALVSQFVLPIHAGKHLRVLQAKTMRQLKDFYLINQLPGEGIENIEGYVKLDESIVQSLIKQRKLSIEASREMLGEEYETVRFQQLLQAEKGILRSVIGIHNVYKRCHDIKELVTTNATFKQFEYAVSSLLESIARYLEGKVKDPVTFELPDLQQLKEAVFLLGRNGLSQEKMEYLNAYLFSSEMLVAELEILVQCQKPLNTNAQ